MTEVMQPMLQSPSSITMLQSRPTSADNFQGTNASQTYQHSQRTGHSPRSMYNTQTSGYRGTSAAPVQPYAFQSTPHLRSETRTLSAPTTPQAQSTLAAVNAGHARQGSSTSPAASSTGTSPSPSLTGKRSPSKDDLLNGSRPGSFISLSSSIPDLSLTNFDTTPKSSPERYRRGARRVDSSGSTQQQQQAHSSSAAPSGSGMASVEHLYTPPPAPTIRTASDDSYTGKSPEAAKRYRRRSAGNFETPNTNANDASQAQRPASSSGLHAGERQSTSSTIRPVSQYERSTSNGSLASKRGGNITPPAMEVNQVSPQRSPNQPNRPDTSPIKVPARGSSEANKRLTQPSPLSQATSPSDAQSPNKKNAATNAREALLANQASSPAAQHLAALSDKDLNKGMKSRLRRAFSFGSAAELRKVSGGENANPAQTRPKIKTPEEIDEEQEEIARQQEAAGFGAGIYSGQGGFTGSTDNLSISSTASSASMMLRKMGKGMKKGGRSIKGLFRPKSVVGVPAADGPAEPSLAQVSMVTVEAERQKVNVNVHPSDQSAGGTAFPHLERNSMDAAQSNMSRPASSDRTDSLRKSIVGSEKDRAEVLAAVKKGILKRNGTGSPMASPDLRGREGYQEPPHVTLTPTSSLPGTPRDERQSRSLTSTGSSNDYFSGGLNQTARSMPSTPVGPRISFSPRIQFHDVWSSTEYDRRSETATCNRLTPLLASQIKEELNTFKMEMEVHELSKPHTHFF